MFCIVYGSQTALIKTRVNKIVKENLDIIDEFNYVKYDGCRTPIQEIIKDAISLPLGYDKKVVVIEDSYFLMKPKPKQKIESEQDYKYLEKYITKNDSQTVVIFTFEGVLDSASEIVKLLISNGAKIHETKTPSADDFEIYVKRYFKEKLQTQIDNDAVKELIKRINGDVTSFQNNALKLSLYTNHVRYEDVCLMVSRPLEENTFQLFNYLISKKNNQAIALYKDLKTNGVEPITLISMLANQFRILNEVSYLAKQGLSSKIISEELKINPIRAEILKKNTYTLSEKTIHKTLQDLFKLDYEIKSGQVDRFYAFELFLIKFKVY